MNKKMLFPFSLLGLTLCACSGNGGVDLLHSSSGDPFSGYGHDSSSSSSSQKISSESSSEEASSEESIPTLFDCDGTEQTKRYEAEGYSSLYVDINHLTGYRVSTNDPSTSPYHSKYLDPFSRGSTPKWNLAQWYSRYDIMGTDENSGYTLTKSYHDLENTITSKGRAVDGKELPAKVVRVNSYTGETYLEANAGVEYESTRTGGGWVHLLLENQFNGSSFGSVASKSSIIAECDFTIDKFTDRMGSEFNPNIHACQVVWYLTLQNLNRNSSEYGKYIWFGFQLWDNRTSGKACNLYYAFDAGTSTAIYNPGTDSYYEDGKQPVPGQRKVARCDIRGLCETAFNQAKKDGYFTETQFSDIYIGGTNFGYEIPGTYDIGTTFHAINVFAK